MHSMQKRLLAKTIRCLTASLSMLRRGDEAVGSSAGCATAMQQQGDLESAPLLTSASHLAYTSGAEAKIGAAGSATSSQPLAPPTTASFLTAAFSASASQYQAHPLKAVQVTAPEADMHEQQTPAMAPLQPVHGSRAADDAAALQDEEVGQTTALLNVQHTGPASASGTAPAAAATPGIAVPSAEHATSSSSNTPRMCRFCHDEDSDAPGDRLISPCLCMGSIKYVHTSCLGKWRDYSPSQAQKCGSCQMEYRIRQVDSPVKFVLRSWAVPLLLLLLCVGLAAVMGFAPVAHDNDHFGWHMLNGEILMGAVGLGVAGYELLSWRSATDVLIGIRGRGWRLMRLSVWYLWRLYVLLCAGLILFLGAYPWFFKAVVALIGIGWMLVRLTHLIWSSAAKSTTEVMNISDEERAQLLQQRREEEARKQLEQRLREESDESAQRGGEEGERAQLRGLPEDGEPAHQPPALQQLERSEQLETVVPPLLGLEVARHRPAVREDPSLRELQDDQHLAAVSTVGGGEAAAGSESHRNRELTMQQATDEDLPLLASTREGSVPCQTASTAIPK